MSEPNDIQGPFWASFDDGCRPAGRGRDRSDHAIGQPWRFVDLLAWGIKEATGSYALGRLPLAL